MNIFNINIQLMAHELAKLLLGEKITPHESDCINVRDLDETLQTKIVECVTEHYLNDIEISIPLIRRDGIDKAYREAVIYHIEHYMADDIDGWIRRIYQDDAA